MRYGNSLFTVVILAVLSLSTSVAATGQAKCSNAPRVLSYDRATGVTRWENCDKDANTLLHPGDSILVQVVNVNPFRRTVNISIQQTTYAELYEVPSVLNDNLIKPTVEDKTQAASAKQAGQKPNAAGAGQDPAHLLALSLDKFQTDYEKLATIDEFPSKLQHMILESDQPSVVVTSVLSLAQAMDPSLAKKAPTETDLTTIRDKQESLVDNDRASFEADALRVQGTLDPAIKVLLDSERQRFAAIGNTRAQRRQDYLAALAAYTQVTDPRFGIVRPNESQAIGETVDEISISVSLPLTAAAAKFDQQAATAGSPPAAPETAGGTSLTAAGTAPGRSDTGTAMGAPAKAAKDKKIGDVSAKVAKASTDSSSSDADQATLLIPVWARFRISFSTGAFFSGLTSPTFFKDAAGDARSGSADKFSTALGALVHTSLWAWNNSNVTFAWTLGVALKDSSPLYVLGPSFILGRRQRTVVSLGVAGGQVTRLSGISVGDPVTGDQVPTAKVFRYSFFFGLSYNFGPTNSDSAKSSQTTNAKPSKPSTPAASSAGKSGEGAT
jgi:hypothetical protein